MKKKGIGGVRMKFKNTLYIHHVANGCDHEVSTVDRSDYDWCSDICIGSVEVEFEFEVPSDIEIRNAQISAIEKVITKTQADAQVKVEGLLDEIQKLMAIGVDS